jgi:hypothetical protein
VVIHELAGSHPLPAAYHPLTSGVLRLRDAPAINTAKENKQGLSELSNDFKMISSLPTVGRAESDYSSRSPRSTSPRRALAASLC